MIANNANCMEKHDLVECCRHHDHEALRPASECSKIQYPAPDGQVTLPLTTALFSSGTNHEHDQPPHLRLRNPGVPAVLNLPVYAGPEARYCPAGASSPFFFSKHM